MNVYTIPKCDENEINRILDIGIQQLKNLHCPENNNQIKLNSPKKIKKSTTISTNHKSPKKISTTYSLNKSGDTLDKIKDGLKQVGASINNIEKKLFKGKNPLLNNSQKSFSNENINNEKIDLITKYENANINDPCNNCSSDEEKCSERLKINQRQNLLNKLEDRERELNNLKLQKENIERDKFKLKNDLENLRKELRETKYNKEKNDKEIETLNVYKLDLDKMTEEFNQLQNQLKLSEEIREQQKELIEKLEQNIEDLRNGSEGNIIDFENIHKRNKEDELEKMKIKEGKQLAKKIKQKLKSNRSKSKNKITYQKKNKK